MQSDSRHSGTPERLVAKALCICGSCFASLWTRERPHLGAPGAANQRAGRQAPGRRRSRVGQRQSHALRQRTTIWAS
jgi:hypothetical protein